MSPQFIQGFKQSIVGSVRSAQPAWKLKRLSKPIPNCPKRIGSTLYSALLINKETGFTIWSDGPLFSGNSQSFLVILHSLYSFFFFWLNCTHCIQLLAHCYTWIIFVKTMGLLQVSFFCSLYDCEFVFLFFLNVWFESLQ